MKRDVANLFSGFMLCLSLVLFLGAGSVHLLSNGPARVDGALTVNGSLSVNGNASATGSFSADSFTATTIFRSLSCGIFFGPIKGADSLRAKYFSLGGETVTRIRTGTFTLDVGSITLQSTRFETVTIAGLDVASNWNCKVQPLSTDLPVGVVIGASRVSADNTLKIEFGNDTIGNIDPASQTFSYVAFRQ